MPLLLEQLSRLCGHLQSSVPAPIKAFITKYYSCYFFCLFSLFDCRKVDCRNSREYVSHTTHFALITLQLYIKSSKFIVLLWIEPLNNKSALVEKLVLPEQNLQYN